MPSAYPLLPADPPTPYVKPTLDNTHGGKTYKPTHPELFRVNFTSSIDGQEGFASRLVAERVRPTTQTQVELTDRTSKQENGYAALIMSPWQRRKRTPQSSSVQMLRTTLS
jgi:hypothetical protein